MSMQPRRDLTDCVAEFVHLRGTGSYDEPTILEAALLIEECSGVVLSDGDINSRNLGSAEQLSRFARSMALESR